MSKNHILFYGSTCPHSINFLLMLKNTNKYNNFVCICADPESGNKIPSIIKEVPSIIVPEIEGILTGEKAFMWLKSFVNNKELNSNEPSPFIPSEMSSSLSDSFSYIENTKRFGQPLLHSYSFLKNNNKMLLKNNKKKTHSKLEQLIMKRDNDPSIKKVLRRN